MSQRKKEYYQNNPQKQENAKNTENCSKYLGNII